MSMFRRRFFLAALVALIAGAFSLAACGESELSREDYVDEVQSSLADLSTELGSLGEQLQSSDDPAELASGLDGARAELEQTAAAIEDLEVPDDLSEINDDLVGAITRFSSGLEEVVGLLESDGKRATQQASAEVLDLASSFQDDIAAAQQKAEEAGVSLVPSDADSTTSAPSE